MSVFSEPCAMALVAPPTPSAPELMPDNGQLRAVWEAHPLAECYEVWKGTANSFSGADKKTKSSTGGIITGYGNDTVNGNKVVRNGVGQSGYGYTVYVSPEYVGSSPVKKLEKTVPANKALDSRYEGVTGGWTE